MGYQEKYQLWCTDETFDEATRAELKALEGNEKTKIRNNVFATNEEAFNAAVDSMKMCMPRTAIIQ